MAYSILSWTVEGAVVLVARGGKVEGWDDAVGAEAALVNLLPVLAVVEEPAEGDGAGKGIDL